MKCDVCGIRDAILFVQQVSGTASVELHLCAECAKERGVPAVQSDGQKIEVSLGGLISKVLEGRSAVLDQNKVCPGCGQSLLELKKRKKAGCAECYTVFRAEILAFLRSEGIEPGYSGNLPRKLAGFRSSLTDRMILQTKLRKAVSDEDYELAALYRDRLRALDESAVHQEEGGSGDE